MALSRGLADTSLFIARETGRPVRTEAIPDQLSVSIVTVGELRVGVLRATDTVVRDRRPVDAGQRTRASTRCRSTGMWPPHGHSCVSHSESEAWQCRSTIRGLPPQRLRTESLS